MSIPYLAYTADSSQMHNSAGASWLIKINCKNFVKPWPLASDIVNGTILNMPLLRADTPLAVLRPVPGTLFYKDPSIGRHGHQYYAHEVGYEIAGDTTDINLELEKDINSRAVFIVGKSDGRMLVFGTSSNGLQIQNDSDSGIETTENKTTVKAFSNVQTRKKLHLSTALESQILSGNDGYGFAYWNNSGFPLLLGNNGGTVVTSQMIFSDIYGQPTGRKFIANDLVELLRVKQVIPGIGIELRPKSEGYATARIASVQNTIGLPAGFCDRVVLADKTAINVTAGSFGILTPSGTTATMDGSWVIQKL